MGAFCKKLRCDEIAEESIQNQAEKRKQKLSKRDMNVGIKVIRHSETVVITKVMKSIAKMLKKLTPSPPLPVSRS